MTYGHYTRSVPRVNVLAGYWGNEPLALKRSAKPKAEEAIKSGMAISLDENGEWVKGVATGKTPFIAFHDQADTDVTSSGLLLGLSCAGQYEIETGWFDNEQTYVEDSPIKAAVDADAGKVTLGAIGTDDLLGFATRGGRQDVTKTNTQAAATGTPPKLYTLTFRTQWLPAAA